MLLILEMTNFLDVIHRLSLIKDIRRFGDWCLSSSSGKTPTLLGPINRASPYLISGDDGDRLRSPKRRVSFIKDRRWITSRKFVISTKHYRHKPLEFTANTCSNKTDFLEKIGRK
jgi:hypothetical protein